MRSRSTMRRALYSGSLIMIALAAPVAAASQTAGPLTEGRYSSRAPSWSPDGTHLAFETQRSGTWDVFTVDLRSGAITSLAASARDDRFPAWSPDGSAVLLVSERDGQPDLYEVGVATGEWHRISYTPGRELFPTWSSDQTGITFSRSTGDTFEIVHLDLRDSTVIPVLAAGRDLWPRCSLDGRSLAFFSRRDTNGEDDEIYVYDPAHGVPQRLTRGVGHDFCPSWRPDGERLVFVSIEPDGARALHVVDRQGSEIARLASGFARVTEPAWSPDGAWIAFAASLDPDEPYRLFLEPAPE